ncbi:MAG: Dickkopf N-terminal cysteine-rich domain-containing protein [Myxococcota bacterium]
MRLHHAVLLLPLFCLACTTGAPHPGAGPDEDPVAEPDAGPSEPEHDVGPPTEDAGFHDEETVDAGPTCVPTDQQCYADEECCAGFCTWGGFAYSYAPGQCALPQADGNYCIADNWCSSGVCRDNVCVTPSDACVPQDEECEPGVSTCCDGNFCFQEYIMGRCLPLREAGEYCRENAECASGMCALGVCRLPGCLPQDGACYWDGDCCEGFCTYTGASYAPGQCSAQLPTGNYCLESRWCESWSCVEDACL